MGKQILFGSEAREAMTAGMNKLADAVTATYGPKGRNAAFTQKYDVPLVTNSGHAVASQITLSGKFENIGAAILAEAAAKTKQDSGDGSTAAVVIARAIINEAEKNIAAGANPIFLKKGIDKACGTVISALNDFTVYDTSDRTLRCIATSAGNNDPEIGNLIGDIIGKLGPDAPVTVEDSQKTETTVEICSGMRLETGLLSRFFITDNVKNVCKLQNPFVFVSSDDITEISQIYNLLEEAVKADASLLIIAKNIKGEALTALAVNAEQGILNAAAVRCPGHGEKRDRTLADIAKLTGAELISSDLGANIAKCGLSVCGKAESAEIGRSVTVIRSSEQGIGSAVISVGGKSELEMFERKYRIENALNSAVHAARTGILPGEGKALLLSIKALEEFENSLSGDEKTGVSVIKRAIEAPLRQIAQNAGADGSVIIGKIKYVASRAASPSYGYDALTDTYVDLYEAGIIDPASVIKSSFQNAVSAAGIYITTAAAIAEK